MLIKTKSQPLTVYRNNNNRYRLAANKANKTITIMMTIKHALAKGNRKPTSKATCTTRI